MVPHHEWRLHDVGGMHLVIGLAVEAPPGRLNGFLGSVRQRLNLHNVTACTQIAGNGIARLPNSLVTAEMKIFS